MAAVLFSMKASTFSREHLMYTFIFGFILVVVWRVFALFLLKNYRRWGFNYRNVVIVGSGKIAQQLYTFLIQRIRMVIDYYLFFMKTVLKEPLMMFKCLI